PLSANPLNSKRARSKAREAALSGALVTFGIKPRFAATSYGYLQRGARVGEASRVKRFCEKAKAEGAGAYLRRGDYFWNGGIFIWQAASILGEIRRQLPELAAALKE